MAQIIYLHHEEISRALIESALQTREIGFTAAAGYEELILKAESGAFYHFASLERLDDNASAVASGAKLIGFAPPAGMSSTDVQSAIEEILASVGGGSLVGSGTAGKMAVWVSGTTVGDSSVLAEASGKINFSGDTVANFYRSAASTMKTDAAFISAGLLSALASFALTGTLTFDGDSSVALSRFGAGNLLASGNIVTVGNITTQNVSANDLLQGNRISTGNFYNIFGNFDNTSTDGLAANTLLGYSAKSNSNTRKFFGTLIKPEINNTAGNSNTTINALGIDTVNTSLIGTAINMLNIAYGGTGLLNITNTGDLEFLVSSAYIRTNDTAKQLFLCAANDASSSDGAFIQLGGNTHGTVPGMLRLFSGNIADCFIDLVGDTRLSGYLKLYKRNSNATDPDNANEVNYYMKGTLIIYQYYDAGTVRYKYLDLTGTDTTWTHTTTAP